MRQSGVDNTDMLQIALGIAHFQDSSWQLLYVKPNLSIDQYTLTTLADKYLPNICGDCIISGMFNDSLCNLQSYCYIIVELFGFVNLDFIFYELG